ncbi:MAG: ATP-dependent RNA helicase HrpA [Burkholderiales bacterium]
MQPRDRTAIEALRNALDGVMTRERGKFLRRLREAAQGQRASAGEIEALAREIEASRAKCQARLAALPRPAFPEELPVSARREEIAAAMSSHQVVVVCGETGSGKTTQLPKICLALGRGAAGLVGHTQPRRIAARTVANRIARELSTPLGKLVGYKIRFHDQVSDDAYVKVMTDGILLAETQTDRMLSAYDTLVIDEAHERSLNIDFLLGYVRQLLPRRPDLKLVVTSATIDAERFSRHFGGAPVVEVSGRLYPVEVRYRPLATDPEKGDEQDLTDAILDAVDAVSRPGEQGDILVFLPGEREIRDTAEALRKHHPPGAEILPLYSRLSAQEQDRVFDPGGARRIVLATNVAETSLTVPRIRYVIDPGYARVNRYSYRNKVEQLVTEKTSRASANQRAGRCGRVMSGVCVRLYDEEDFAKRPEFTDPEILRSSLASVILRMASLNLGHVEQFPFLDLPQPRMIADGYQLLNELGAIDAQHRLTAVGTRLAKLPIDPRIGRMVLAAKQENCLAEVLVIAAALSVQDPRERPLDKQGSADLAHVQFLDERSDFLSFLRMWAFFEEAVKHKKSNRKLAEACREHFLSYLRLREWRDIHGQLHALVTEMGLRPNEQPATYEQIHRALLTGLLGNIGTKGEEPGEYTGARGIKFRVHPGSGMKKQQPKWLVAAELVETTRLYARHVARVEPEWIEQIGAHLVQREYFDPHWERKPAQVVAFERVSLYGLVVNPRRRVHYGPIDAREAREIFIRGALVAGEFDTHAPFFAHNRRLREEVEALEHKSRRLDVLVDDERVFAFYDARVPEGIVNGAGFEKWRREAERETPRRLFMAREDLMRHGAEGITSALYPEDFKLGEVTLPLTYRFEPGHALDGVTLTVPLHLLNQLDPRRLDWLVPGMLREKVNALLRALPKQTRKLLVPVPETVTACLVELDRVPPDAGAQSLTDALAWALKRVKALDVPPEAWDRSDLPAHLSMNISVVDDDDIEIASGRDLQALRDELGVQAQQRFAPENAWERTEITAWDGFELPEAVSFDREGHKLTGFPALVDAGESVTLTMMDTADKARDATRRGVSRLVQLALKEQMKLLERSLPGFSQLALLYANLGNAEQLRSDLVAAIVDRAVWVDEAPVRDHHAFEARVKQVKSRILVVAQEYARLATEVLLAAQPVRKTLDGAAAAKWREACADMRRQLARLIFPGFIVQVPYTRLQQYPRYLKAMARRLEKIPDWSERDAKWTAEIARLWKQYDDRLAKHRKTGIHDAQLEEFRWQLEELRVSLFAQELRTPAPVSVKRLEKLWGMVAV